MANAFYLTETVAQGMLNSTGLATALGASGLLKIYSGTTPANADASETGTVLATLTLAATPLSGFGSSGANAQGTFGTITSGTAGATGTASHFRIFDSTGATVKAQGTVGTSGCDLNLNTTSITSGSTVSISSATITLPVGP